MSILAIQLKGAREFAKTAHGKQKYGSYPYVHHLDDVRNVAFEFGVTDEDILIATVLHDILEDTNTLPGVLASRWGHRVAKLVEAVTTERGKNRKDGLRQTYPKILSTLGATTLKLCDRIANVRACWNEAETKDKHKPNRLGMYRGEYGSFRKNLMVEPTEVERAMWKELDRLMAWREE